MPLTDPFDPAWQPLLEAAWAARERAHAPYSGFRVGAALQTSDGAITPGCNVENAAYPLCTCAERGAVAAAVAQGRLTPGRLTALAVVTEADRLTPPCGACRQVLSEFAGRLPILLANRASRAVHDLADLLPLAFGAGDFSPNPPVPKLSKGRPTT
ncbi:MAG TPA: cytidine deaminase [Holophagaceae bacterium]|nr:cytidine deaminase [Holophagaceae bacterium]